MKCPKTGMECGSSACVSGCGYVGYFHPAVIENGAISWQVCPKCNGSGVAMNYGNDVPMDTDTCDVCNGKKIISIQTGQPPV